MLVIYNRQDWSVVKGNGKGKVHPRTSRGGPEEE